MLALNVCDISVIFPPINVFALREQLWYSLLIKHVLTNVPSSIVWRVRLYGDWLDRTPRPSHFTELAVRYKPMAT